MSKRGPGRPAKEPEDLITIDQAVTIIKDELRRKYKNEEVVKSCALAKGTIRNKIYRGELHSWRKGKYALLSRAEVIKLVA